MLTRSPPLKNGLLFGQDAHVAEWAFKQWGSRPMHLDMCVGVVNPIDGLVGAFAFNHWNGCDCELHFYGPHVLRKDIVRAIFQIALDYLTVSRVTVRTRKEHMARGVVKLGAEFECMQRCIYGADDTPENSTRQYVFHRAAMLRLAGR